MSDCKSCSLDTTPLPQSGVACGFVNENPLYSTGNCAVDANGFPIVTPISNNSCTPLPNGILCPVVNQCSPWDMTQGTETCLISNLIAESINISGAILNVYRLLGVHEQGSLQDLIGAGEAISSGDMPNFPAKNAFDKYITEWRSLQTGSDVLALSYIGYDFGPVKLNNGRLRYGIETAIKHDVSRIMFKQGCDPLNRVTKVRIERSNDGVKWFGVNILNVPDCDGMITLAFNKTVPSRYWRIRPLVFNGGVDDYWVVQAVQMIDYESTAISNIQDRIWMENRDRDYDKSPIKMKGAYTVIDVIANQNPWSMGQEDKYSIEVSFTQTLASLGRPFVIGDMLQLPSETQYSPDMTPVLKYLMISDVAWSTNGYTPNWVPTIQRLIAIPAQASQETQDVTGKLTQDVDASGFVDIDSGSNPKYQDFSVVNDTIKADANTAVPERGEDTADITKLSPELLDAAKRYNFNLKNLDRKHGGYNVDAMPPNGLPYTEGDAWPTSKMNGDYHRLTYDKVGKGIPARLYRWSSSKTEWVYLETDRRYETNNTKPLLQEYLDPERSTVSRIDTVDSYPKDTI